MSAARLMSAFQTHQSGETIDTTLYIIIKPKSAFTNTTSCTKKAAIFPDEIRYFTSLLWFFLMTIGLMQGDKSSSVIIKPTMLPYFSPTMC